MAELLPLFLWLCAVLSVTTQASQNVTVINETVPVSLSFPTLPPTPSNATWPPFDDSESIPHASAPPPITQRPKDLLVHSPAGKPSNKTTAAGQGNATVTTPSEVPVGHASVGVTKAATSQYTVPAGSLSSSSSSPFSTKAAKHLSTSGATQGPGTTPELRPDSGTVSPTLSKTHDGGHAGHVSIGVFLAVPVCTGLLIISFILFGRYCRKKLRLDKLRHQLMPMYNFDAAEGEDWETELLSDQRSQPSPSNYSQRAQASPSSNNSTRSSHSASLRPTGSTDAPQLRFSTPAIDV